MATKKTKPAPVVEKPAAKAKATKSAAWGITEIVTYVNAETGASYDSYNLRIVLRKLAKDGAIERGEGRYSFTGANDPQVKAIIKAIKSGAAEKAKTERLADLKSKKAASKTTAPAKGLGKKAPVVEDDDLLEDLEDDDDDEE